MAIHTWPLNLKLGVQSVQIATLDIRVGLFILGHFTSQNRISKKIEKIKIRNFWILKPCSLHSKSLTVHNSRMHWSKSNNDLEVNDEIGCFLKLLPIQFSFSIIEVAKVQNHKIIFPDAKNYPYFFGLNNHVPQQGISKTGEPQNQM